MLGRGAACDGSYFKKREEVAIILIYDKLLYQLTSHINL